MANSLIEDMFSENSQFSKNSGIKTPKKGNKKILLVILALIIIIGIVVVLFLFKGLNKNNNAVSAKTQFINYLLQNPMANITDTSVLNGAIDTLINNSSESDTAITITSNIEELDTLTRLAFDLNTKYDAQNHRGLLDIDLGYMDNAIFDMQALITGQKTAIKSDEIVTRFVGYKNENLINAYEDFFVTEDTSEFGDMTIEASSSLEGVTSIIKNIDFDFIVQSLTSEFLNNEFVKYSQILNTIDESKFSQKEVTLEKASGNVSAVAYSLKLNEVELISLGSSMLEELKNDTELFSILTTALEPTGISLNEEMMKLFIDKLINATYELEGDTSVEYVFTLYVVNGQVSKMTVDTNLITFEANYDVYDNELKADFTLLDKELNSGITININRISSDVSEQFNFSIGVVNNNEVVGEIVLYLGIEGINSQTEMNVDFNITYADTENEIGFNTITKVEFKEIEVEDLTSENCLLIDELNEEQKVTIIDSIKVRTGEILTEKFNQINIINSNVNSSIIEGIQQEDTDEDKKEEVKEKLINAVATEMYNAEQNGETYTVNDIADLEMEDVELEVFVENDVATVTIDGYTFSINAAFELSE